MAGIAALKPREVWLSAAQVAERVPGLTVEVLKSMRATGNGPAYYKPTGQYGKITLYSEAEVDAWIARGRHSTSEQS